MNQNITLTKEQVVQIQLGLAKQIERLEECLSIMDKTPDAVWIKENRPDFEQQLKTAKDLDANWYSYVTFVDDDEVTK